MPKRTVPPEIRDWLDEQARLKRPQREVALDLLKELAVADAQTYQNFIGGLSDPWTADEIKWAVNVYESARQRERARLRKLSTAVENPSVETMQAPAARLGSDDAQKAQEATRENETPSATPPTSVAPPEALQERSDSSAADLAAARERAEKLAAEIEVLRSENARLVLATNCESGSRLEQVLAEGLAMHTDMGRKVYEAILALYNGQKTTEELLRMIAASTQQTDLIAAKDAEIETLKGYVAHLQRQVGAA